VRRLALITVLVPDYDEAIAYFTGVLGFSLVEDTPQSETKRWVVVSPGEGCGLLIAKATTPAQTAAIGRQAGDRVALFLHTGDIVRDHAAFSEKGVVFEGPLREEDYGRVTVFRDLYGNRWDLIEPRP